MASHSRVLRCQHALEYRLKPAGRAGDDFQHFGGRGLPRQRLGKMFSRFRELARARFELPFQLGGRFRRCVQRALSLSFSSN